MEERPENGPAALPDARWSPAFLRIFLAACMAVLVCLHMFVDPIRAPWTDLSEWGLRILKDWRGSDRFVTIGPIEMFFAPFLVALAVLISLRMVGERVASRVRVKRAGARVAFSLAFAAAGLLGLAAAYPAAKEAVLYPRLLKKADSLTVVCVEECGVGGPGRRGRPKVLYSGAGASRLMGWSIYGAGRWPFDMERRERKISGDEMRTLLTGLRDRGFFRFSENLYPHGTIDGRWRHIWVGNEEGMMGVSVWAGTKLDPDFQCCVDLIEELLR